MDNAVIKPVMLDEVVFQNDAILLKKIAFWEHCSLWKEKEEGLFKVYLPGSGSLNGWLKVTFAFLDGSRATDDEFCYLENFSEGLALVGIAGQGYRYIDKNIRFITPVLYKHATDFHNGFAVVVKWNEDTKREERLFIDKTGKEHSFPRDYAVISDNSEGLFRVSDLDMGSDLAFISDYDDYAGIWGYVDINGKEIVSPQYIYAFDFENGRALVCKGKWTKDKKWNNECNTGKYWREEELWGMIDKNGNEIIPCQFDEIKYFTFNNNTPYLQAHYGGWGTGKWGIIDYTGNWVVEPIFADLDYDISDDGCFAFYAADKESDPDNVPMGLYSIPEQRIIVEPQFFDIDFLENGCFKVHEYNEQLKRSVDLVIDKTGKPVFESEYTSLSEIDDYYKTMICDVDGNHVYGLIDRQGNEIIPCKYEETYIRRFVQKNNILFKQDEKYGLMSFDGSIILEPHYTSITNIHDRYFIVKIDGKEGLITKEGVTMLPIQYTSISVEQDIIIARDDTGSTLLKMNNHQ